MGKSRGLVTYEVPVVIPLWRLWRWCLIQLGLHIGHCASHVGQQLRLCGEELLHPYLWQWWWHLVVVVLVVHVVGMGVTLTASSSTLYWRLINS